MIYGSCLKYVGDIVVESGFVAVMFVGGSKADSRWLSDVSFGGVFFQYISCLMPRRAVNAALENA